MKKENKVVENLKKEIRNAEVVNRAKEQEKKIREKLTLLQQI